MSWSLTVAAIIERSGRFLMVEETDGGGSERVLNQPAGHVDPGESILDAVIRETWEETGTLFAPEHLIGVYQLRAGNGQDYCRICFSGLVPENAVAAQDAEILACHWLTRDEIAQAQPRSSLVLKCIDDYLAGQRLPLSAAATFHTD